MLRYNELVKIYNELASMSRYDRMHNAKAAYEKLESLLQEKMGHGPGYFAATRVACALVAADGQLTRAEHELFREFATSSCTYDELYDSAVSISKDFKSVLDIITTRGSEIRFVAGYLAAAIFAEKGMLGENEEAVFRIFAED